MFRPTELSQIPFIISTPSQGPANARTVTQHRNRNPDRDEINDAKWGATNFVACRETLGKNYGEPHLRLRDIEPRCLYDISDSASEQVRLDPGAHFKKFPLSFSGEYYGRNARVTIAYAALALSERSGISYTECLYFTILIGVYPRSHINRPSDPKKYKADDRVFTKLLVQPSSANHNKDTTLSNRDIRHLQEVAEKCEKWCREVSEHSVYNWLRSHPLTPEVFRDTLVALGAVDDVEFKTFVHETQSAPLLGASSWVDIENALKRVDYYLINNGATALRKFISLVELIRDTGSQELLNLFTHQLWYEITTQLPPPPSHYGLRPTTSPHTAMVEYYTDLLSEDGLERIIAPFLPIYRIKKTALASRAIDFANLVTPILRDTNRETFGSRLARFADLCELLQLEATSTNRLFSALRDPRHTPKERATFLDIMEQHLSLYDVWNGLHLHGTDHTAHEFIYFVLHHRQHSLTKGCIAKTLVGLCHTLHDSKRYQSLRWIIDHHRGLIVGDQQIGVSPKFEQALLEGEFTPTILKRLTHLAEKKISITDTEVAELFPALSATIATDSQNVAVADKPTQLFEARHLEPVEYVRGHLPPAFLTTFEEHYRQYRNLNCFRVMLNNHQLLVGYCSAVQDAPRLADLTALFQEAQRDPSSTELHTKLAYILVGKKSPLSSAAPPTHTHKTIAQLAQEAKITKIYIFGSKETLCAKKQADITKLIPGIPLHFLFAEQFSTSLRFSRHDLVIALTDHIGHEHTRNLDYCFDNRGGTYQHPLYPESHTNTRILVDDIATHLKALAIKRATEDDR